MLGKTGRLFKHSHTVVDKSLITSGLRMLLRSTGKLEWPETESTKMPVA